LKLWFSQIPFVTNNTKSDLIAASIAAVSVVTASVPINKAGVLSSTVVAVGFQLDSRTRIKVVYPLPCHQ